MNISNQMTRRRALTTLAALPLALSVGCSALSSEPDLSGLRMLIPNTPGGGYDVTARTASRILENRDLTGSIEKFNVVGGGGSVALARLMRESGNENLIAMVGVGVVGAAQVDNSPWKLSDATALARLVDEPEALVVGEASPLGSAASLAEAWRANPRAFTVGAGSAVGGPDHVFAVELARTIGIDPNTLDIVTFDGAGDLLTAIIDGSVDVGIAGAGEYIDQVDAGSLRILAVSNPTEDAPTLRDSGIDLEFTNWRGFVAPPDIPAVTRNDIVDVLRTMRESDEWHDALARHRWADSFLPGDEFSEFLAAEDLRMRRTLEDLHIPR
ncbi:MULTISPECIES: tripartite tricarboxylate transporter substrate binding protein [Nocardiaceae]|uniref:Bug family tripartite tricarboxylate transporter substrate binding protein n=1 Tax=Nocardiaceae TaxID=85025 RepID=UPI00083942DE|nr:MULTISPECIES: tripartite tricarboxylate transporter substrate binding protein [Rhodococcus]